MASEEQISATWSTPRQYDPSTLYEGMPKHQDTALMLLRTEVIGLNAWLVSVRVPGILLYHTATVDSTNKL